MCISIVVVCCWKYFFKHVNIFLCLTCGSGSLSLADLHGYAALRFLFDDFHGSSSCLVEKNHHPAGWLMDKCGKVVENPQHN